MSSERKPSDVIRLFMASAGIFIEGYETAIMTFAILLLIPIFKLQEDDIMITILMGAFLIGEMIGMLIIGWLADIFGRRTIYIYDMLILIIVVGIQIILDNIWIILAMRFLSGILLGADIPVSNSYIAEISKKEVRGKFLSFASVADNIGYIVGTIVPIFVFIYMPNNYELGWRLMLGIPLIFAAIVLYFRLEMPESERWEMVKGKLLGFEIIKDIFKGLAGKFTIINSIILFLYIMVTDSISMFLPMIAEGIYGNNVTNALLAELSALFLTILALSSIFTMFIVDTTGRKSLQIIGFVGVGFFLMLAPYLMPLGVIYLIFIAVMMEFFNGMVGTTTGIFPAELTKTEFRGTTYGFVTFMGNLGSIAGIFIIGLGTNSLGPSTYPIIFAYGILMVIGALLTLMLVDITNMELDELFEFKMKLNESGEEL
ncbi:MAG: MFS transporter [Thermoplasmata archaeon]